MNGNELALGIVKISLSCLPFLIRIPPRQNKKTEPIVPNIDIVIFSVSKCCDSLNILTNSQKENLRVKKSDVEASGLKKLSSPAMPVL